MTSAIQSIAAAVQALFAILIFVATRRYVAITSSLAKVSENQFLLQREAFRANLYEKRLKVFRATTEFLAKFAAEVRTEQQDIHKLLRDTNEAQFLFGPEVVAFISELRHRALEHRKKSQLVDDPREIGRRDELMADVHRLEDWLMVEAFQAAREKFAPYLKFNDKDIGAMFAK
ncbi:MAG TPA: hypothetical protein VFE22_15670 [Edaphobacter sp.]|nr:hypothetical protein [Edaphobacter sp.]